MSKPNESFGAKAWRAVEDRRHAVNEALIIDTTFSQHVREVLGGLLIDHSGAGAQFYSDRRKIYMGAWNEAVCAAARALLAIPPDAPSPLEDDE